MFMCPKCTMSIKYKRNLDRHEKICGTSTTRTSVTCPACKQIFAKIEHLRSHVQQMHNISLEVEQLTFNTKKDFEVWKSRMEKDNQCQYTNQRSYSQNGITRTYLCCYRSGFFKSVSTGKRRLKKQGTNKINATCTSTMVLIESVFNIDVIFHKTHFGHDMNSGSCTRCPTENTMIPDISSTMPEIQMRSSSSEIESNNNKSMEFETLLVTSPKPFVYHVELNRAARRNAMNNSMWLEIPKCFEILNEDENCRSIVISGSGSSFCSGIDLQCFMDVNQNFKETDDVARRCKALLKLIRTYQNSLSSIEKCVKPVIAVVHSSCIGAGVDLICSADIRYCTSDAWFQIKEVDLGLAADVGTLQRFPKIIANHSLARELVFTGRQFYAKEAKEIGFVNRIFDSKTELIEESLKIAELIASKSPVAVQTAKKSLIYSRDHSVEEGLEHIALINQTMLQSEDLVSACMGAFSKNTEPPVFSKL